MYEPQEDPIAEDRPVTGILNRQSRAERQNTFDWLHILPVRVTISQYKPRSANGSHILPVEVIFCQ